jgi:hypothetical protein
MDVREIGCEGVDWMYLIQERTSGVQGKGKVVPVLN